jgi:hypothetical protein
MCSCEKENHPPDISDQDFNVTEYGWFLSGDPMIKASDPDGDQNLDFRVVEDNGQDIFRVHSSTGQLSILHPELIDYESVREYRLKVAVSDNHPSGPLESSAIMRIHVFNANEFTDGLVAYYPFEGDADDDSGNQHHGEVHGALLQVDRNGQSNEAYYFDGIDDYISLPDPLAFSFTRKHFSISFWIQALTHKETSIILSKGSGDSDREYAVGIDADSLFFIRIHERGRVDQSHVVRSTTRVDYVNWYHVSAVRNESTLSIFVNGRKETSMYCNTPMGERGAEVCIGGAPGGGNEFPLHGVVDELYIHGLAVREYEFPRLYPDF